MYYTYQSNGKGIRVVAPHIEAVLIFARKNHKKFTMPQACTQAKTWRPQYTLDDEGRAIPQRIRPTVTGWV